MRTTACKSNGPSPGRREGEQPSVSPACWDQRARGWRPRHQKRVAHHLLVPTYRVLMPSLPPNGRVERLLASVREPSGCSRELARGAATPISRPPHEHLPRTPIWGLAGIVLRAFEPQGRVQSSCRCRIRMRMVFTERSDANLVYRSTSRMTYQCASDAAAPMASGDDEPGDPILVKEHPACEFSINANTESRPALYIAMHAGLEGWIGCYVRPEQISDLPSEADPFRNVRVGRKPDVRTGRRCSGVKKTHRARQYDARQYDFREVRLTSSTQRGLALYGQSLPVLSAHCERGGQPWTSLVSTPPVSGRRASNASPRSAAPESWTAHPRNPRSLQGRPGHGATHRSRPPRWLAASRPQCSARCWDARTRSESWDCTGYRSRARRLLSSDGGTGRYDRAAAGVELRSRPESTRARSGRPGQRPRESVHAFSPRESLPAPRRSRHGAARGSAATQRRATWCSPPMSDRRWRCALGDMAAAARAKSSTAEYRAGRAARRGRGGRRWRRRRSRR